MVQLRDVNTTDIGDAIAKPGRQIVECVKPHRTPRNEVKDNIHAHS